MKITIDFRSVLIALVAGTSVWLVTQAGGQPAAPAPAPAAMPGRYQISTAGEGRIYVLDQGENAVYLLRDVGGGGWDVEYSFAIGDTLTKFKEREKKGQRPK